MATFEFGQRLVLVTGSTSGIGYAIAERFAASNARIIVNGRSEKSVDAAIASLKSSLGDHVLCQGIAADLSTKEGCDAVISKYPDVDVLVNNTGIYKPTPFAEISDEEWLNFFQTNVMSGVRLSRHYLTKMIEKNDHGRIVFVSSESGLNGPPEMIHYGMTKAAQISISRGMAQLTKGTTVTVNTVLPGPTFTPGVEKWVEEQAISQSVTVEQMKDNLFKDGSRASSLLSRFIEPAEIANMVVYISSTLSSATNGAALRAEGGILNHI